MYAETVGEFAVFGVERDGGEDIEQGFGEVGGVLAGVEVGDVSGEVATEEEEVFVQSATNQPVRPYPD